MRLLVGVVFCSALCAQKVAFVQDGQLWVKAAPAEEARSIVSSGAPHAPEFSTDGEWIAFLDAGQLGVVMSNGGEIHRPLGAQPVSRFRWNGTGASLAVVTEDSVYVTSASAGWMPSRVFAGEPESVVFSLDGKQIAIASLESNQDGIPQRGRLGIFAVDGSAVDRTIATASQWEQILPFAWSGDTIVAWKGEISASMASGGFEVWGYSVSGGAPRRLGGPALVHGELHALSPDGSKLALTNGEGRRAWTNKKITVVDIARGDSSQMTSKDVAALYPAWSPNRQRIAFIQGPDAGEDVWGGDEARAALNQRHLWIMDADGDHKRQLTSDSEFRDERPVWSADGKSVLFLRLDHNDQASVWKVDFNGGEARLIAGPWTLHDDGWFGYYGLVDWNDQVATGR
jgi:dipeptidyl aminopeptidase/acylaminoacyl peptidase